MTSEETRGPRTTQRLAVLVLAPTGVVLTRRATSLGEWSLGIPVGPCDVFPATEATATTMLAAMLDVTGVTEEMGGLDGGISLFRVRLDTRSRPRGQGGVDAVTMDFASFEEAISAGRIVDAITIAAWMRHRLLEGETTRRRRLPRVTPWTPERISDLTRMWLEGTGSGDIAKTLGVTRNAVMGRLGRLGLMGQGGTRPSPDTRIADDMKAKISLAFEEMYGRQVRRGRRSDDATLVAIASLHADRDPAKTASWAGLERSRTDEILDHFHEEGVWQRGDEAPTRWISRGGALAMMMDAQIGYGLFMGQVL